jgi:hypothetical protein
MHDGGALHPDEQRSGISEIVFWGGVLVVGCELLSGADILCLGLGWWPLAIEAGAGFVAARRAGVWAGFRAGLGVGMVHGTLGLMVLFYLGPVRAVYEDLRPSLEVLPPSWQVGFTILFFVGWSVVVALMGAICGLIGGGVARLAGRTPAVAG